MALTATQKAVVEAGAKLPIPTPSAIARVLNRDRATIHEHLAKPNVSEALAKARAEGSDKARASLAQLDKSMQSACKRLENIAGEGNALEAVAIIRTMVEMIPKYEAYLDNKHAEERDVPMLAEVERAALERGVRLGEYLERRRARARRTPQDLVVQADSQADNPPATLSDPT